jgi:hypothetical protein
MLLALMDYFVLAHIGQVQTLKTTERLQQFKNTVATSLR